MTPQLRVVMCVWAAVVCSLLLVIIVRVIQQPDYDAGNSMDPHPRSAEDAASLPMVEDPLSPTKRESRPRDLVQHAILLLREIRSRNELPDPTELRERLTPEEKTKLRRLARELRSEMEREKGPDSDRVNKTLSDILDILPERETE